MVGGPPLDHADVLHLLDMFGLAICKRVQAEEATGMIVVRPAIDQLPKEEVVSNQSRPQGRHDQKQAQ